MFRISERLAIMNPHGPRLDGGGRGGIPELTPQDMAAAIGMTPRTIGRELLHWLHGCGREHPREPVPLPRAIDDAIAALIAEHRRDRLHRRVDAQLNLALAREMADASRRVTDDARYRIIQLTDDMHRARDACWPGGSPAWSRLRRAIVHELSGPSACHRCDGRGSVVTDALTITCEGCGGTGRKTVSGRGRARWLGVDEKTYRQEWRGPYETIYAILRDALADAERAVDAAAA